MNIPELPYDNIHKFLAAVGSVLIVLSLFVEPVYLDSETILSIGSVAVILGLTGWGLERAMLPYIQALAEKGGSLNHGERRKGQRWSKILRALRLILPLAFLILSAIIIL
ncbi:hypothetical protein [Haloarcula rubripromontorii]|uniref:hypothetical protein n=1 Tax=Haloarcula rubripromontorii TaxID=1705562 RepID=UPI00345BC844